MKHPCKKCIVKISCSQDCKEYKSFVKFWAQGMTILSFFLAALILAPIIIYANYLSTQGIEILKQVILIFWVVCIFAVMIITELLCEEPVGIIILIFCAPIMAISYFIINLTKKWFWKYSVRA